MLGGGLVPGSLVLLGGSPGIGKSTLTGMALGNLAAAGRSTLYVSGEESAAQVRLRAERLGEAALAVPALAETALEPVLATLEAERPQVCVIDSIQTLHCGEMSGAPGSVGQVREAAGGAAEVAKRRDIALILVGHVTKEGSLAGPRALEHLVDCVLRFEGERERTYRTLRALKNRFGATSEVGVFEMRSGGLTEVADPSARFVEEATRGAGIGRAAARWRARRPLLVEVQALVAPTELDAAAAGRERDRPQPPQPDPRGAGPPRRGSASPAPTSSSTSPAACGSTSPAPTSRSRWRVASAHRGEPLGDRRRGPLACFGELGPDRRAALRRPPRPPRRRGAEVRPRAGDRAGRGASEQTARRSATRRRALRASAARRAARLKPPRRALARSLDKAHSDLSTRNSRRPHCKAVFAIIERDGAGIRGWASRAFGATGPPAAAGPGHGRPGHAPCARGSTTSSTRAPAG